MSWCFGTHTAPDVYALRFIVSRTEAITIIKKYSKYVLMRGLVAQYGVMNIGQHSFR